MRYDGSPLSDFDFRLMQKSIAEQAAMGYNGVGIFSASPLGDTSELECLYLLWGEKMKKKILIGILAIVLIIVIGSVIYVSNGSSVRESAVMEYLENRGYSQSQIQSVQAKYSFLNTILGYQAWGVEVVFADEQNVIYGYRYDSETGVSQGSVSGGDKNTQKEDLKHVEK